jgi:hypothetical protein
VSHFVGLDLGQSAEHTVHPKIRETQVPSTLSSSLCPESTQRRPAKPSPSGFAGPTPRLGSRGIHPTEYLYVWATLSIGLYLLLEGPAPTRIFYPATHKTNL